MAVVTYIFKALKRIGLFIGILVLTSLALSIRQKEENVTTLETTTELYRNRIENTKFVLLWTDPRASPLNYFGKGSYIFREKSCKYTNCYVTGHRHELGDVTLFDAIIFNGPQLQQTSKANDLPKSRSSHQIYIYANVESAHNYPLCDYKGFFNLTWTYKLDSDIAYGYYVVKDKSGDVVAPKLDATWVSESGDISEELKAELRTKEKAVAWFATNCHTKSRREDFVEEIRRYLKEFSLSIDVYGACGSLQCPSFINERCLNLLSKEYYFYFAFENSFSEDYVTEKVLNAYRHNTVPVVYGAANYSRFLPPGSYLNGRELGAEKLAQTINYLINNPEEYQKYFKWQNHYSFHYRHESPQTDDYCGFCEALNSGDLHQSLHMDIEEWWNANYSCVKL